MRRQLLQSHFQPRIESDVVRKLQHMHDELEVGSRLGVSLPRGGMTVDPKAMNLFVAGGIGITPFVSAILDMERRGLLNYKLHWSNMGEPGLLDMLSERLSADVEQGRPFHRVQEALDLSPETAREAEPLLAVAVGLALPGVRG